MFLYDHETMILTLLALIGREKIVFSREKKKLNSSVCKFKF